MQIGLAELIHVLLADVGERFLVTTGAAAAVPVERADLPIEDRELRPLASSNS